MTSSIRRPEIVADIFNHLKDVDYPLTGKKFIEACGNMSHLSKEEKAWVRKNIEPDRTYTSPEELQYALDL